MRQMQVQYKISFIFSSHDREVLRAADDVIYIKDGVIRAVRRRDPERPVVAPPDDDADEGPA